MTFWRDRPTFVTGATGFLGQHLVAELLRRGADVTCLVRDQKPDLPKARIVWGDVCDQYLLERAIGEGEINTVFHLAAQTQVGVAGRNAGSTYGSNISGTCAVLEACRRSPKVRSIVVASTDKVYGQATELPTPETAPLLATHPYDVSKAAADMIARSYASDFGLPVAVTRCGNLFGGGDLNWSRLIPGTIRSILRGEAPVLRSDGTPMRDWLYVKDAVSAYLMLAQKIQEAGIEYVGDALEVIQHPHLEGEAFNFSSGNPQSADIIAMLIAKILSREDLRCEIKPDAKGEIKHQYLDSQKAHWRLGWSPRYTLDAALVDTVDWYRRHFSKRPDQVMVAFKDLPPDMRAKMLYSGEWRNA